MTIHAREGAARHSARTVFIVQVSCTEAGSTRGWQLKKRYGYFERAHRTVQRHAAAGSSTQEGEASGPGGGEAWA